MELDDLKNTMAQQAQLNNQGQHIEQQVSQYSRAVQRSNWIETGFAVLGLLMVIAALLAGDTLYPMILQQLAPELAANNPTIHPLMYFSLVAAAVYFVWIPIKLHRAQRLEQRYSWSLTQRIDAEITLLKRQQSLWTNVELWSFVPAFIIGCSFFWGLQVSLLGTWVPSLYLIGYFIFTTLAAWGGVTLKRRVLANEVEPLLQELTAIRSELSGMKG